jgi:hypothetical protein
MSSLVLLTRYQFSSGILQILPSDVFSFPNSSRRTVFLGPSHVSIVNYHLWGERICTPSVGTRYQRGG